jgi:hypothetical protein
MKNQRIVDLTVAMLASAHGGSTSTILASHENLP